MPKFPRIRQLGDFAKKGLGYFDRGLQRIGNPTGKAGARIAGTEKLIYGAELGVGAYTVAKLHGISKRQKEHAKILKTKKSPYGHSNYHPVRRMK